MTEFHAIAVGPAAAPRREFVEPARVLIGGSPALESLRREMLRVAAMDDPVLIHGEVGTGKSLVAGALHEIGPRASRPCAVVACDAIPVTLLHVELFGCTRGSVAGATSDRQGILETAAGGTVVLENIDAMNAGLQLVLARFLASGRVQAVGAAGPGSAVDTRILLTCASDAVHGAGRRLQPELAARLAARHVRVPPLRERPSDVAALAQFFADPRGGSRQGGARFSPEALRALSLYSWPGNVSQLRAVVERLAAERAEIQAADLPVGIRPRIGASAGGDRSRLSVGDELFAHVQASGQSFWASVYPLFMKREITRADLRDLLRRARAAARGDANALLHVLNMPGSDRPKFLRFLRKYNCEVAL